MELATVWKQYDGLQIEQFPWDHWAGKPGTADVAPHVSPSQEEKDAIKAAIAQVPSTKGKVHFAGFYLTHSS